MLLVHRLATIAIGIGSTALTSSFSCRAGAAIHFTVASPLLTTAFDGVDGHEDYPRTMTVRVPAPPAIADRVVT